MQMVKKYLLWAFLFWFALLFFMPKAELYYALERELATQDIRLNEASIESGLLYMTIRDVDVYVKGVEVANIESIHFYTLLGYSTVTLSEITVDDLLKSQVPSSITEVAASHNIFSPLSLSLDANGSFGVAEGELSLLDGTLRVDLLETKEISTLKAYLKQDEKGWYYETSF